MSAWLHRTANRVLFLVNRARIDRELAEEIGVHLEMKRLDALESGLSRTQALEAATREMGNLTLAKEESRNMWMFLALEKLMQDLRYALRVIARSPVFSIVAIISLAIGIGGNVAMFSLVDALLIRPLPYKQPEKLVRITGIYPRAALVAFQQECRGMDVASFTAGQEVNLSGEGEAMRLTAVTTSANFFQVLGAGVQRGRAFEPGEDRPVRSSVAILSNTLWRTRFDSDPEIVGRVIRIDGVGRKIVGVMPPGFAFPSSNVQLWLPTIVDPSNMENYWGSDFAPLIGRLHPDANLAQVGTEIQPIVTGVRRRFPFPMKRDWNSSARAVPLQEDMVGEFRGKLLILLASVGIVLVIACANVASLLLSRATTRRKEIAMRTALGANRGRIVRQLLTESVLLSILGAMAGILLGSMALSVFRTVLPADTPGLEAIGINSRVLIFTVALAILTGLSFGLAPALSSSQLNLAEAMKTGSQRSTAIVWARLRSGLIAGEVALTMVLVIAAGLLMRSLFRLSEVDPGFQPAHVMTLRITPNQSLCENGTHCVARYNELLARARAVPGVIDAAVVNTLPLDGMLSVVPVDVQDHPKSADFPAPMFWTGDVSAAYLRLMRIPVLEGRGFTSSDSADSEPVVLVTASTARHFWPGRSAIGKHVKTTFEQRWRTIVGVVGDVRQYDLANQPPDWIPGGIYMPYAQSVQGDGKIPAAMDLVIKTASDTTQVSTAIRQLAVDENPNTPVGRVQTMKGMLDDSVASYRSTMWIFFSFAVAALSLAAVGLYGLISYSTAQRTYEIGVRLAVGASKSDVIGMIVSQGVKLTLAGMAVGFLAALVLMRTLSSLLFGVSAFDPVTFVSVGIILFSIAILASIMPARRAARIDPIRCLRVD